MCSLHKLACHHGECILLRHVALTNGDRMHGCFLLRHGIAWLWQLAAHLPPLVGRQLQCIRVHILS